MEVAKVKLADLIPDANNNRLHGAKNFNTLKSSLSKWNQVEPLVVNKRNNIIIGGNCRYEILKQLGVSEVYVSYVDLNASQAAALATILNRSGELGEWNEDMLSSTLSVLDEEFNLEELGFDEADLKNLGILAEPKLDDIDDQTTIKYTKCPSCGYEWENGK